MKLKYIKTPRPMQKELTASTSLGVFKWLALGDVVELPDQAGHEVIAHWPGCVEELRSKSKGEHKMASSPENKSAEL